MKQILLISVAVIVIGLIIAGVLMLGRRSIKVTASDPKTTQSPVLPSSEALVDAVQSSDIVVGTGTAAISGKKVTVNYTGTLVDGTKFDSSYDRNQPFSFTLGAGDVIKGWDQGVVGMKTGGKRHLIIPATLGYGDQGAGDKIKPGATLVFDIELISVQ